MEDLSAVAFDKDFRLIVKPYEQGVNHKGPRQRAGAEAEKQMAFYLHRDFRDDEEVFVLHDLRIEDQEQPEQDGSPGVCQIDHLVVHRWGLFIIESKSVTEEVRVRSDGSGGDEWTRVRLQKEAGMPSPIRQAQRQANFLRAFLQRHREELLGRAPFGSRAIVKIVTGTDQHGFKNAPIQLMVAVSDTGRIKRIGGWKEPRKPFRVFVTKADLVPDKILQELKAHRKNAGRDYGVWRMRAGEPRNVAEFLAARHVGRPGTKPSRPNRTAPKQDRKRHPKRLDGAEHAQDAACRHCGSRDLTALSGQYGYYWKCGACQKNTTMPAVCSACGAKKGRDSEVRVRKDKTTYFRDCQVCGTSEIIWTED